eukprot:scaffold49468_cov28-Tisochrysis_lutea.AAC.4
MVAPVRPTRSPELASPPQRGLHLPKSPVSNGKSRWRAPAGAPLAQSRPFRSPVAAIEATVTALTSAAEGVGWASSLCSSSYDRMLRRECMLRNSLLLMLLGLINLCQESSARATAVGLEVVSMRARAAARTSREPPVGDLSGSVFATRAAIISRHSVLM